MIGNLYQLMGDGWEELYWTPDESGITEERIRELYSEYCSTNDYEDFEEFLQAEHFDLEIERVFVDEIIV